MPSPQLGLPDAPETIAFRAVVKVLQSDPTLSAVVGANWSAGRGTDGDRIDPTPATCPHVRLSQFPGPSKWETEGQHHSPMVVRIELHTAGDDVDQIANLWHAVRRALFPPATSDRRAFVEATMNAAAVTQGTLTQNAYGPVMKGDAPIMSYAAGSLELVLLVTT